MLIESFLPSLSESYCQKFGGFLFWDTVYIHTAWVTGNYYMGGFAMVSTITIAYLGAQFLNTRNTGSHNYETPCTTACVNKSTQVIEYKHCQSLLNEHSYLTQP